LDAICHRGYHNCFEQQNFIAKAELACWLKQPCSCYFGSVLLPGEPLVQDQTQILRMGVEKLYSGNDLSSQGEIAVLRLSSIYGYVPPKSRGIPG